ncbi:hypothetical protein BEI61_05448 [Eisenbergiella tayi]|uniref:Uncharacterized protein n=1 Tax=Eisenbergiella tayi TaxID=1432052 RepID=A0A1E3A7N7_9FIRM|nr:hypothetical protein BEI61_05448 [Eisenbergiella tayi]
MQEERPGGKGLLAYTIKKTKSDNYLVHFIFCEYNCYHIVVCEEKVRWLRKTKVI